MLVCFKRNILSQKRIQCWAQQKYRILWKEGKNDETFFIQIYINEYSFCSFNHLAPKLGLLTSSLTAKGACTTTWNTNAERRLFPTSSGWHLQCRNREKLWVQKAKRYLWIVCFLWVSDVLSQSLLCLWIIKDICMHFVEKKNKFEHGKAVSSPVCLLMTLPFLTSVLSLLFFKQVLLII